MRLFIKAAREWGLASLSELRGKERVQRRGFVTGFPFPVRTAAAGTPGLWILRGIFLGRQERVGDAVEVIPAVDTDWI